MGRVVLAGVVAALLVGAGSAHAGVVVRPRFGHVVLRTAPGGGAVVARLGRRTEFGSPLAWSVKARRGRWIGVLAPQRPNGRLSWIDVRALRISKDARRIDVSLSRRMLWLRRGGRVLLRVHVGIGSPVSPTPTGWFAVTDRLAGADFAPYYGCCILALSGHQPHPPPSWRGSDTLLAIHGGPLGAVSNGCLHAPTWALRFLMRHVPLGTRVTICA